MIELTSKQRKYLEKLAHDIEPVVIVGAAGVTEGVTKMVAEMLGHKGLATVKAYAEYDKSAKIINHNVGTITDAP